MANVLAPSAPSASLTVAAATGQGRLVKSAVLIVNVAIANGALIDYQFPTVDDNLLRFFIGLHSTNSTAGVLSRLLSNGRRMVEKDNEVFDPTHGPQAVYVPCAPNIQLVLEILNKSGGAVTPVSYTVDYAVDDPNWTIGG
jgi:hypothetical protein